MLFIQTQALLGINKITRDLLPHKGLHDIAEEILNSSYLPPPNMKEEMTNWEEKFDKDHFTFSKMKQKEKKLSIDSKRGKYQKRKQVFMSSEDISSI